MKNKIMTLTIAGMLTLGGISVAYATGRNDARFNNINRPMMGAQNSGFQSNDSFNDMINIMKNNGFNEQARAMENGDFDNMQKFMLNISDEDYKKMIELMEENKYGFMANMMQNVNREDMIKMHKSMMGR